MTLKEYQELSGLTGTALAHLAGINQGNYSQIVNNKKQASKHEAICLVRATRGLVSFHELFGVTPTGQPLQKGRKK